MFTILQEVPSSLECQLAWKGVLIEAWIRRIISSLRIRIRMTGGIHRTTSTSNRRFWSMRVWILHQLIRNKLTQDCCPFTSSPRKLSNVTVCRTHSDGIGIVIVGIPYLEQRNKLQKNRPLKYFNVIFVYLLHKQSPRLPDKEFFWGLVLNNPFPICPSQA